MSSMPPAPPEGPSAAPVPDPYARGSRPVPAHLDPWVAQFNHGPRRRWGLRRSRPPTTGLDTPMPGPRRIGVVGLKGGAGKTTVSVLLATTLARARPDPVLLFDTDTRFGSLSLRTGVVPVASVADLARTGDPGHLDILTGSMSRSPDGVWVLPSGRDPAQSASLNPDLYTAAMSAVYRHFPIMIIDCGAGLATPLMRQVLGACHSVVLATTAGIDGLTSTADALTWLRKSGYAQLAAGSLVVLTKTTRKGVETDLAAARSRLESVTGQILALPADPHLAVGSAINLDALAPATQTASARLAAAALAIAVAAG